MLSLLLIVAASMTAAEIAGRLPLIPSFRQLASTGGRAKRILVYRRCLETRKERVLQRLSLQMLRQALHGGGLLMLVIAPFAAVLAVDSWLDLGVAAALLDWKTRLVLIVVAAFFFIRLRARRLRPC